MNMDISDNLNNLNNQIKQIESSVVLEEQRKVFASFND